MITAITGAQFGDEGKGKITDYLAESADLVVRWSGGANAGHTIQVDNKQYKLKLIPSGAIQNKELLITGNCIIDPEKLLDEVNYVLKNTFNLRLSIDHECIITLPIHKKLDAKNDMILNIGTTKSGIGPTVSDFANRIAIKVKDLLDNTYAQKLKTLLKFHTDYLEEEYQENLNALLLLNKLPIPFAFISREKALSKIKSAKHIIFEGAQGTMLDINHGTYPYCTSTACLSSAIPYVLGLGNLKIDRNIGVFKAYLTRVGNGDMPTEILDSPVQEHLQTVGKEIGTNTGRTRRVGWLNIPELLHAISLNDFNELALVKLDVFAGLNAIAVLDKNNNWANFEAWQDDISNINSFEQLPPQAKTLIEFIEAQVNLPVTILSIGPDRNQTIRINRD